MTLFSLPLADVGHLCLVCFVLIHALRALLSVPLHTWTWLKQPAIHLLRWQLNVIASISIGAALAVLMVAFYVSDFSLLNVAMNSHTLKPALYRLAAAWGSHEGSLILWLCLLQLWLLLMGAERRDHSYPAMRESLWGSLIALMWGAFAWFTSSPFVMLSPTPIDGLGLNPVLQHPALVIHPPLLYAGSTLTAVLFVRTLALSPHQRVSDWAQSMRGIALMSWSLLTAGIGLGSWWAYQELGWGGWWFWDPVENIALLPWLSLLALMHSLRVCAKHSMLSRWSLILSVMPLLLVAFGLFFVRAGMLTSVHAFASDPTRGVILLMIALLLAFAALTRLHMIWPQLPAAEPTRPASRSGLVVMQNMGVMGILAIVLLGTLLPPVLSHWQLASLSLSPSFFNISLSWLVYPLLMLMALTWHTHWQGLYRLKLSTLMALVLCAALLIVMIINAPHNMWPAVGIACAQLALWLNMYHLPKALGELKLSALAAPLMHAGFALTLTAMIASMAWQQSYSGFVRVGDQVTVNGWHYLLRHHGDVAGPNFVAQQATVRILTPSLAKAAEVYPSVRFYPVENDVTTEPAIYHTWLGDHYVMIGRLLDDGQRLPLRIYYNPLMRLLWLGWMLLTLGGLLLAVHTLGDVTRRKSKAVS